MDFPLSIEELHEKREDLLEEGYEPVRLRFGRSNGSGAKTTGVDF